MQRLLVPMFTFFWWGRLSYWSNHPGRLYQYRGQVVKVKDWRTALIDEPGRGRKTITFCFWWFK